METPMLIVSSRIRQVAVWIPFILLSVASIWLAVSLYKRPTTEPQLLPDTQTAIIDRVTSGLRAVPDGPECCFFTLADDHRTHEELARLGKVDERIADWSGVVYCYPSTEGAGLRVGRWLLFGDEELVQKIARRLR
jgi:hypothetical protein